MGAMAEATSLHAVSEELTLLPQFRAGCGVYESGSAPIPSSPEMSAQLRPSLRFSSANAITRFFNAPPPALRARAEARVLVGFSCPTQSRCVAYVTTG